MNLKKGKLVRGLFATLSLLLAFCMLLTGCGGNGVQNVLDSSSTLDSAAYNRHMCAYKSDKTEFDINDVTLELSYGCYFINDVEWELEHSGESFSFHELYLESMDGNRFFIKRIDEDLISEKYRISRLYDENDYFVEWKFNYSEMITIPKEVFADEYGRIAFRVYGENTVGYNPLYKLLSSAGFSYKVFGDKVVLSEEFGEAWENGIWVNNTNGFNK